MLNAVGRYLDELCGEASCQDPLASTCLCGIMYLCSRPRPQVAAAAVVVVVATVVVAVVKGGLVNAGVRTQFAPSTRKSERNHGVGRIRNDAFGAPARKKNKRQSNHQQMISHRIDNVKIERPLFPNGL